MMCYMGKNKDLNLSIAFLAVTDIGAVCLLALSSYIIDSSIHIKQILVFAAIAAAAFVIQLYRLKHDFRSDGTALTAFGVIADALGTRSHASSYDIRYDYIRLFAVFAVIFMHCLDAAMPFLSWEITDEVRETLDSVPRVQLYSSAILRAFLYLGNTCFLMLTGALMFGRSTPEGLFNYYKKFILRILLPFIIYFVFYMWQNGLFNPLSADSIREAVNRIKDETLQYDAPFMWLIYVIISIHTAVPFLRYMFRSMSYRMLSALTGTVLFGYTLIIHFYYNPDILPFFSSGWIGISFIGYWVSRPETRRYDKLIWIAGALSFISMAITVDPYVYWQQYINRYVHFAPMSLFMACSIFALALHKKSSHTGRLAPIVTMLSQNSYTILLLHWWSLYHIMVKNILKESPTWEKPVSFIFTVLLVICISFISGFLMDRSVVYVARTVVDKLLSSVQKLWPSLKKMLSPLERFL